MIKYNFSIPKDDLKSIIADSRPNERYKSGSRYLTKNFISKFMPGIRKKEKLDFDLAITNAVANLSERRSTCLIRINGHCKQCLSINKIKNKYVITIEDMPKDKDRSAEVCINRDLEHNHILEKNIVSALTQKRLIPRQTRRWKIIQFHLYQIQQLLYPYQCLHPIQR